MQPLSMIWLVPLHLTIKPFASLPHTAINLLLKMIKKMAGIHFFKGIFRKHFINKFWYKEEAHIPSTHITSAVDPSPSLHSGKTDQTRNIDSILLIVSIYTVSFSSSISTPLLVLLFFCNVGIRLFSPALTLLATSWSELWRRLKREDEN